MKNRIAKKWAKKVRSAKERDIIENQLINPIILEKIVRSSNLCQHGLRELNLISKGHDYYEELMHYDIMSLLAVISYQNHSNYSIYYALSQFKKLAEHKILSSLTLTEEEWNLNSYDGSSQNIRATNIFKEKTGEIIDIYAFSVSTITIYDIKTNEFKVNPDPMCYASTLYEYKDKILTGRYFRRCKIITDENGRYFPKEPIIIPCTEIEYANCDYIMCVDKDNSQLATLNKEYDIMWQYDSKLDGVKFKDFTKEIIDHE